MKLRERRGMCETEREKESAFETKRGVFVSETKRQKECEIVIEKKGECVTVIVKEREREWRIVCVCVTERGREKERV